MSDLRSMLNPSTDAAGTEATPAPDAAAAESAKTAPASEPEANAEGRDAAGKFKAKEPAEDAPGVAKRIGKALAAQRAAEQRAEAAEAKLLEQPESRPAPAKPAAEIAPPAAAEEPESKNFDTYEAYNKALVKFMLAQDRATEAKTAGDRKAADAEAAKGLAWNERVEAAKAKLPDFADKMAEAAELPISKAMHETIFESERGPEVAYYLASNPEEAARIEKLGPLAAAREIGKIEAGIAAPPVKPAPAAKALPKPPAQAGGSHSPSVFDFETADPAAFGREFKKRLAKG
jgi:hypothetical protein